MNPRHLRPQIPNALTISRVIVILPIALLLEYGTTPTAYAVALVLSLYAMVTDFFDGYLSRKWGVVSDLGRLLDPVADKLLVAVVLIMVCAKGIGSPLAVSCIIFREIFISGLREFMQEKRVILHVSTLAKYKTATQMIACAGLLMAGIWQEEVFLRMASEAVLWIAAILTLLTGYEYLKAALKQL
jgi:cardiolipin synthase (CMP-forming)